MEVCIIKIQNYLFALWTSCGVNHILIKTVNVTLKNNRQFKMIKEN